MSFQRSSEQRGKGKKILIIINVLGWYQKQTHTHARTHARTHTRTRARTDARTHARTHTHTELSTNSTSINQQNGVGRGGDYNQCCTRNVRIDQKRCHSFPVSHPEKERGLFDHTQRQGLKRCHNVLGSRPCYIYSVHAVQSQLSLCQRME